MPIKRRVVGKVKPKSVKKTGKLSEQMNIKKKLGEINDMAQAISAIASALSMTLVDRVNRINKDEKFIDTIESGNLICDLFYLLSYAYYRMDTPIVSDGAFDRLCKYALKCINDKKPFVTEEMKSLKPEFQAGTGFALDFEKHRAPTSENVYNLYTTIKKLRETTNAEEANPKAGAAANIRRKKILRKPR